MTSGCLLDSNVLIYYFNGQLNATGKAFVLHAFSGPPFISIISRIEILGWRGHTARLRQLAEEILTRTVELPLTADIAERCIPLRQSLKVKLPDLIIGATALHLNMPLVTRSVSDFRGMPGLQLIDPFHPSEVNRTPGNHEAPT